MKRCRRLLLATVLIVGFVPPSAAQVARIPATLAPVAFDGATSFTGNIHDVYPDFPARFSGVRAEAISKSTGGIVDVTISVWNSSGVAWNVRIVVEACESSRSFRSPSMNANGRREPRPWRSTHARSSACRSTVAPRFAAGAGSSAALSRKSPSRSAWDSRPLARSPLRPATAARVLDA